MKGENMENEKNAFGSKFDQEVGIEDKIETDCDENNRFFRARILQDDCGDAPWEMSDGHGPVSNWRRKDTKAPGERILIEDRGMARFYDIQEATKIAKRDGWGCGKDDHQHKTRGEQVACAVQQDFDRLEDWCNDRWCYVGVVISLHQLIEDEETGEQEEIELADHLASLWGIESDCGDYLTTVANELLEEAKNTQEAKRLLVHTN